ncbi:MAG: lamin tail domain-containing protein, partial [Verrucomicrobiales bacterium]
IREAADRNCVRWKRLGVYDWPNAPGFANRKTYQEEVNFMRDWVTERLEWFDDQFERPVKFSQQGGQLEPGTVLTMENKLSLFDPRPGKMYYTLDGSDPRLRGGEIDPDAHLYEGGVTLTESGTVKARLLLNTGDWSAINEANFIVGELASSSNLRITEIMYNPAEPTAEEAAAGFTNNDDFEYLELLNTSSAPIQLYGAMFGDGVNFDFTDGAIHSIDAGERVLVVANVEAFNMRYGSMLPIAGAFTNGKLSNGGETIQLVSADGVSVITEFAYDDDAEAGWAAETDGGGHSLVLVNEKGSTNFSEPAMWTKSAAINGSPGAEESGGGVIVTPPADGFQITEIVHGSDGITISFTSEAGASYEVQMSDDLTSFSPVADVDGADGTTSYKVTIDAGKTASYVRVAKK